MTKKTLKWRLKELPNGEDVARLVEQKVITADEARELLFNKDEEDTDQVAALREEIKFLRDLVDKLAAKSNGWTTIYHEYQRLTPSYPVWYKTYQPIVTYMNTIGTQPHTINAVGTGTTISYSSSSNTKGLSSLN